MVLDLSLPDISGFALLGKINETKAIIPPPVVVYTGKDLSKAEVARLEEHSETVIIQGAKSAERLLDETALFLHQVVKPKTPMIPAPLSFSLPMRKSLGISAMTLES